MRVTEAAVIGTDVVLGYGSSTAVERSSFTIPAIGVTAMIGPNGSGKSTLLNAIAGLLEPMAGTLRVTPLDGRPRRMAHVLQTTHVNNALPISVREVVTMGRYASAGTYGWLRRDDRRIVEEAMERVAIGDLADRRLHELSGGQRQRVFVAQGLAQEHDLLLLDEPLTGVDLPSAQAIDDVVHREFERGHGVIMTTHDLSEARVADHVLLLAGRVIASGPPDKVLVPQHLSAAYGQSLLHISSERVFLDDPAHRPPEGRHIHRERSIHIEPSASDFHGGDDD